MSLKMWYFNAALIDLKLQNCRDVLSLGKNYFIIVFRRGGGLKNLCDSLNLGKNSILHEFF